MSHIIWNLCLVLYNYDKLLVQEIDLVKMLFGCPPKESK